MGSIMLRVALWALAALMVPLVASRVVQGWDWPVSAFVFVYVLFFGIGMAYALIVRRMSVWSYKTAVAMALLTGFGLGWSTMVQTADSGHPERLWYLSVPALGLVKACLVRWKPSGLAITLFTMAAALTLISVLLRSGAPPATATRMAAGHAVCVILLLVSGLLFRHAAEADANASTTS
jgi:hypothetical protein